MIKSYSGRTGKIVWCAATKRILKLLKMMSSIFIAPQHKNHGACCLMNL
jgi:hypothetical protein